MGILEAMRAVQDWYHRIPLEAEPELAELFGTPVKAVHEVATFYPYFTQTPTGKFRIGVCRNLACTLAGAQKVLERLQRTLGVREGEATPDGLFSFEAVECIGSCESAPAWMVNERLCGRADDAAVDAALERLKKTGELPAAPPPAHVWRPAKGEDRRLLTRHFDRADLHKLSTYRSLGGYKALEKARAMKPAELIEEVKKGSLRGLGGAGFPVGMKWSTVPPKAKLDKPHYLVVNFDESEPGCYKDRVLGERSPHLLIEGALIAAHAIEADLVLVFIRGEYERQREVLLEAIEEARKAGLLKPGFSVMRGASAYISGADSALLESIEGKKAWPRQFPPFPTVSGVMGHPTVVNNVETLCMLVPLIEQGAEAFLKGGYGRTGGTAVYSVSGHAGRPGVYEFPMGTPLSEILAEVGPPPSGRPVKAVIPGGTSTPVLTASELGVRMEFDSLRSVGSFLGAGGLMILDDSVDMADALLVIERFLHHESCGQCTPCREGAAWTERILERIRDGGGAPDDLANVERISENITGKVICALGDTVGMVAKAMLTKFRADFERRMPKEGPVRPKAEPARHPSFHSPGDRTFASPHPQLPGAGGNHR